MGEVPDSELHAFGWAPGGYTINCVDCPGGKAPMERWGAKRSSRCREHAVAALEKIQARVGALPPLKRESAPAAGAPETDVDGELAEHWRTLSMGAHVAGDEWAVRYLNEHFILKSRT